MTELQKGLNENNREPIVFISYFVCKMCIIFNDYNWQELFFSTDGFVN